MEKGIAAKEGLLVLAIEAKASGGMERRDHNEETRFRGLEIQTLTAFKKTKIGAFIDEILTRYLPERLNFGSLKYLASLAER